MLRRFIPERYHPFFSFLQRATPTETEESVAQKTIVRKRPASNSSGELPQRTILRANNPSKSVARAAAMAGAPGVGAAHSTAATSRPTMSPSPSKGSIGRIRRMSNFGQGPVLRRPSTDKIEAKTVINLESQQERAMKTIKRCNI